MSALPNAKRVWTVADFAEWMGVPHRQARTILKRLNAELGGLLLQTNGGKKPEYTFLPSALAKAKPEIFERVQSLAVRVDELEETVESLRAAQKLIASQTAQNTRDIAKSRKARAAA